MKYLVQVWTVGNQEIHRKHWYKFDLRDYSLMKIYERVNTTILEYQDE